MNARLIAGLAIPVLALAAFFLIAEPADALCPTGGAQDDQSPYKYRCRDTTPSGPPISEQAWAWNSIVNAGSEAQVPGTCTPAPAKNCNGIAGTLDWGEYSANCLELGFAFQYHPKAGAAMPTITNSNRQELQKYNCVWVNASGYVIPDCDKDFIAAVEAGCPGSDAVKPTHPKTVTWDPVALPNVNAPGNMIAGYWAQIYPGHCPDPAFPNPGIWFEAFPESVPNAKDARFVVEWQGQVVADTAGDQYLACANPTGPPNPPPYHKWATFQIELSQAPSSEGSFINVFLRKVDTTIGASGCPAPNSTPSPEGGTPPVRCRASVGIQNDAVPRRGLSFGFGGGGVGTQQGYNFVGIRYQPNLPPASTADKFGIAPGFDQTVVLIEDGASVLLPVLANDSDLNVDKRRLSPTTPFPAFTDPVDGAIPMGETAFPGVLPQPGPPYTPGGFMLTNTPPTGVSLAPSSLPNGCTPEVADPVTGSITITPDYFWYAVEDLDDSWGGTWVGHSRSVRVEVVITCVNDAPTHTLAATQLVVFEDTPQFTTSILTNVSPGGGIDELSQTVKAVILSNSSPSYFTSGGQPKIDIVDMDPGLGVDLQGVLSFTSRPDFCSPNPAVINYRLEDNGGTANNGQDKGPQGQFTIRIDCLNDAPEFAKGPDLVDAPGTTVVTVKQWATAIRPAPPTAVDEVNQQLTFQVTPVTSAGIFTTLPTINALGELKYALDKDACGFAILNVVLRDNGPQAGPGGVPPHQHESPVKSFKISIDCPIHAVDDRFYVPKDTSNFWFKPTYNDQPLGFISIFGQSTTGLKGSLTVDSGDPNAYRYTPPAGFEGETTFTYTIVDSFNRKSSATVTITVGTEPFRAVADKYRVLEDGVLTVGSTIGALVNDRVPSSPATVLLLEPAKHGKVTLAEDGGFVYTPKKDFHGTDEFAYQALSGGQASNKAIVSVDVGALNDAPGGVQEFYLLRPNKPNTVPASVGVLANDFDPEGTPLQAHLSQSPQHGSLNLGLDGSFTYQPHAGYLGPDQFNYRPYDGDLFGGEVLVQIDVQPNKAPVADFVPAKDSIAAGSPITFADKSFDPDGIITEWLWAFGDGGVSNAKNPTHIFVKAGQYDVQLTLRDDEGFLGSKVLRVTVTDQFNVDEGGSYKGKPPVADAGLDQEVFEAANVVLDGRGKDGAKALAWHWTQLTGPKVKLLDANTAQPKFNAPLADRGQAIELVFRLVIFDGHHESAPDDVRILVMDPAYDREGPRVDIGTDRDVIEGETVRLVAKVAGFPKEVELEYTWKHAGGVYAGAFGTTPEIAFKAPSHVEDAKVIVLVTVRGGGFEAQDTVTLTIQPTPTVIAFETEKGRGLKTGLVHFTPTLLGVSYEWDFGDGSTPSTDVQPVHSYEKSGTYDVVLKVTSEAGETSSYTQQVRVFVPEEREVAATEDKGAPAVALPLLALALLALVRRRTA